MGIFVEFGKGEKECFEPVPVLTKEYYKNILEKFDCKEDLEIDLVDIENCEKVNLGDDLLSQEYKLELNTKGIAKRELREKGIYARKDWPTYLDAKLIRLLVESGVSVNSSDNNCRCFLSFAIYTKDIELVNFLFSQEESVICNNRIIYEIAECSNTELIEVVLSYKDNKKKINVIGWRGKHPLYYAIKRERIENIRVLLKYGADINCVDVFRETPLYVAIDNNNIEIAKELISRGANVNLGKSILINYLNKCSTPDIEFVKFLIENGLDIYNIFHEAMSKCNAQVAELLCKNLSMGEINDIIFSDKFMHNMENLDIFRKYI